MNKLKIVVAVSQDPSDIFFANYLCERFTVEGIVIESQRDDVGRNRNPWSYFNIPLLIKKLPGFLWRKYLKMFAIYNDKSKRADFGLYGKSLVNTEGVNVIVTKGNRRINESQYIEKLKEIAPDLILVCGTSILGNEFLSIPKLGVLNLHGGLSQFYRGLWTTDWAIHDGLPEAIGATVHYVSEGVDDGDIVYQARPEIASDDDPHSLYVKVVKLGVKMMAQAVRDVKKGTISSQKLEVKGRLCRESSYTHKRRTHAWRQIREGVIVDYLSDKAARDMSITPTLLTSTYPHDYALRYRPTLIQLSKYS